jgi:hypothetical protein
MDAHFYRSVCSSDSVIILELFYVSKGVWEGHFELFGFLSLFISETNKKILQYTKLKDLKKYWHFIYTYLDFCFRSRRCRAKNLKMLSKECFPDPTPFLFCLPKLILQEDA